MKLARKVFNRLTLVAFIVVIQVALFIALHYYISNYLWIVQLISSIVAIILFYHVVSKKEPPEFKIPWITLILTLPAFGIILFLLFYPRRVRKKEKQRIIHALNQCSADAKVSDIEVHRFKQYSIDYSPVFDYLRGVTSLNGSFGNDVKYYPTGQEFFKEFIENLKEAEHFIFLEFFIVAEGQLWQKISSILKEKAAVGVEVRLIMDDFGSSVTFSKKEEKALKMAGIKIFRFNPFNPLISGIYNNRDHRKIAIIDHKYAFTGGINIADEYANIINRFGYWKDTMIRIQGKAITNLIILFMETYDSFAKNKSDYHRYCSHTYEMKATEGFVFPFGDGPQPYFQEYVSETVFVTMLNSARHSVYISTPYLVPTFNLLSAVKNAALRGVEVNLIMPGIPDKKIVNDVGKSNFKYLIAAGVNIYIYKPGFNHMKTVLVDNCLAYVGTANFDYRSLVHHFENGVILYKCTCLRDIKLDLVEVISESVKVDQHTYRISLFSRIVSVILSAFSTML
ncbi:MAG: cardiolipin synthase [Erysipelotrichia bacterium]|nr:cardiolipin synthase [Erysipelotrichia bacterium]